MTTFTVSTTADVVDGNYSQGQLSLREAVNLVNGTTVADTIVFAPSLEGQTLVLTGGELVLTSDVAIHGGGVTIDGNGADPEARQAGGHRILNIAGSGTDVSLDNLTLTKGSVGDIDGSKGGAILLDGGSLTMMECTVSDNSSTGDRYQGNFTTGGGIHANAGSRLAIVGCSIVNNWSNGHYNGWGGGISGTNSTMTIRDSELSGNQGHYGGGAVYWSGGSLTIENGAIKNNQHHVDGYGGALLINNATAVITQSTISNNNAEYGGSIFTSGSRITIVDSTIANNFASLYGGAVFARGDGALTIRNSTITGNRGGDGAIDATTFDLDLANCIVAGNTGDIDGTITSSNGHNIFGSDVLGNNPGDREGIAPSAIFAVIDPETGGGLVNSSGIVLLRNALDNPALSGADPIAASAFGQLGGTARPLPAGSLPDIGSIEIKHTLSTKPSANNDVITDSSAGHTVNALGGADYIKGMGGNDTLHGNDGSDLLDGGAGNDKLFGDAGIDLVFYGGSTKVTVDLSLATDKATRGSEVDTLSGVEGAIGSSVNDTFKGDVNINWFQGGLGKDTATGGGGRDLYDFNAVADSKVGSTTRDVITDFDHLVDRIDLMGIDADTTVAGNQAFHWVGTDALTGPGEVGYFTSAGTTIVHGSNDADAGDEFQIQLSGSKALAFDDFYL